MTDNPIKTSISISAAESELIGTTIAANYEIVKPLGRGGWSSVYLAKHRTLGTQVAVKLLDVGMAPSKEALQRFELEAKAMSLLKHPNIVYVLDYGVQPRPFIVMEFLQGKSLADILKTEGPIDWRKAVALFQQVCDGLYAAHLQGVVHRDIKPSNIMVCSNVVGQASTKILDFGIAKLDKDDEGAGKNLTSTEQTLGSPAYMSPEQCLKEALDARSDIYSLGCLMFEILTGQLAFSGRSQMEVMQKHLIGDAPDMVSVNKKMRVPKELEETVARCMARSAADRYATALDLKADLELVLEGKKKSRFAFPTNLRQIRRAAAGAAQAFAVSAAVVLLILLCTVWRLPALEGIWRSCYAAGVRQFEQKQYGDAANTLAMADRLAESLGAPGRRQLQTKIKLAECLMLAGKSGEADKLMAQVGLIKSGNPSERLAHDIAKSEALISQKQYLEAEPLLQQILKQAEVINAGRNLLAAQCDAGLAAIKLATGDLPEAEKYGRRALLLRQELLDPDDVRLAYSYNDLGAVLNLQSRYAESKPLLETALAIAEDHQAGKDVLHLDEGDEMFRRSADALLVASIHDNLATAAANMGQRSQAESALQQDIDNLVHSSYYRDRDMSMVLASQGKIMLETDRLAAADDMFHQAAALEEKLRPYPESMAYILRNWGLLRARQGRFDESSELLSRSLGYAREVEPLPSQFINAVIADLAKVHSERRSGRQAPEATADNLRSKDEYQRLAFTWWQGDVRQAGFLKVTAAGARGLAAHPDVDELDCQDPSTTDADLKDVDKLTRLWQVILNNTSISGETLKKLSNLKELAHLSLETQHVDDKAIAQLRSNSIKYVSLNKSAITSRGAEALAANCPNVESLGFDATSIDDSCIPALATLKHLRYLNVSGTKVTDKGLLPLLKSSSLILLKKADGSVMDPAVRKALIDGGIIVLDQEWRNQHPSSDMPGGSWQRPMLRLCLNPAGQVEIRGH